MAPGSEMKYTFMKDSDNKEYENLTDSQTYDTITLNVKTISGKSAVPTTSSASANDS